MMEKKKYIMNQKTFDQTFSIMKDFVPVTDDKLAKIQLLGGGAFEIGETNDARIFISDSVEKDSIICLEKQTQAQPGIVYAPYATKVSPMSKEPIISLDSRMTEDEIAKHLLSGEIDPKLVWIYEYIKVGGVVDDIARFNINVEAEKRGFSIRWLEPNMLMTMDFQTKRINVHLNGNRIERIDIG